MTKPPSNPLRQLHARLSDQAARCAAIAEEIGKMDFDNATVFELADLADRFGLEVEFRLLQRLPQKAKRGGKK
jgi:hypothetical protein